MSALALAVAFGLAASSVQSPVPADPVEAGQVVTFPFPKGTAVVVGLNSLEKVRERLNRFLQAALPRDAATIERLLDDQLAPLLKGRDTTAIRQDARLFLAFGNLDGLPDELPPFAILVPITGYREFRERFLTEGEQRSFDAGKDGVDAVRSAAFGEEQTLYLVDLKEYVAITADATLAEGYAADYTPATSEQLGSELAETFLKADLAVYVNADALLEQYGEQIQAFRRLVEFGLEQARPGDWGAFTARQIDAVRELFPIIMQAVQDCQAVVVAAEFRAEGLFVKGQIRFGSDSPTSRRVANETPDAFAALGKMPAGWTTYEAFRFSPKLRRHFVLLDPELSTPADDARGAELIEQHLGDLAAAGPGPSVTAYRRSDTSFAVMTYENPEKAVRALTKAYKAVAAGGRVQGVVVKTAPRVADEAETHRGFTFSSVYLNHDFPATVAGLPESSRRSSLELLRETTPEKAVEWIGTDRKVVVRVRAKEWADARAFLDQYLDGKLTLETSRGFRQVREQLPREANWLLVTDLVGLIEGTASGLRLVADEIPGFPALAPLKNKEGRTGTHYLGLALTCKADTITFTAYIPASTIDAGRGLVRELLRKIE